MEKDAGTAAQWPRNCGVAARLRTSGSKLERVEVGIDVDGDPITSCIVVPIEAPTKRNTQRKLSPKQRIALAGLDEVLISHGKPAPTSLGLPSEIKCVDVDLWKTELFRRGALDKTAKNPRQDFIRLRLQLADRGAVGVRDDLVWKAT